MILRSALLEAPHAFSTREGGVSGGVFASLNFGNPGELAADRRDPPENIRENWRRLLERAHLQGRELVQVHQVHGAGVLVVRSGAPAHLGSGDTKADAIVTDDPRRVLAVRVADCAPVLIAGDRCRVVAAVHAGWRGVIAGVVVAAVERMRELGALELVAVIGPCISARAFEVGPEVVAEFDRVFSGGVVVDREPSGKARVDLSAALEAQLLAAGVGRIDAQRRCTAGEPALFFSHRRDHGLTGRMAAVIGPRDPAQDRD